MTARAELLGVNTLLSLVVEPRNWTDLDDARATVAKQRSDLREMRADATAREHYITDLEANCRAQANIIADFQTEHALTLAETFDESDSISKLSKAVAALVNVGHEVVMRFELVADRRSLNVYVKAEA